MNLYTTVPTHANLKCYLNVHFFSLGKCHIACNCFIRNKLSLELKDTLFSLQQKRAISSEAVMSKLTLLNDLQMLGLDK